MIFHLETVDLFNNLYVTSDRPEPKDLETPLEVGSWAWNWMEPPLGQISFFLLCMQYARAQMENLGLKPYTKWYKDRRARILCEVSSCINVYIYIHMHVIFLFCTGIHTNYLYVFYIPIYMYVLPFRNFPNTTEIFSSLSLKATRSRPRQESANTKAAFKKE